MYNIINQHDGRVGLGVKCASLGVSRDGYRKWAQRGVSQPKSDVGLRDEMEKIAVAFPRYGYRRMTIALQRKGFPVNHKRVLRLMRENSLLCAKRLFRPLTTNSNHNFRVYPNLAKGLGVTGLNQLWVADITYVHLLMDFVYLAVINDVFSRRCVGWWLDRNIDTLLPLNALNMALRERQSMDLSGLIHHSDQGSQYASDEYVARLKEFGIRISMSRRGNPYDNAFAESFIKTLKYEEVYLNEYESFDDAHINIKRFIEDVYNKKRLHSSIGYKTPDEFEMEVTQGKREVILNKISS